MKKIIFSLLCLFTFLLTPEVSNSQNNSNEILGEYLSIKNHPKSKGVNLKLQVPNGWEAEESPLPNTVKAFTDGKGNSFRILIKENLTFLSRNQAKEILNTNDTQQQLKDEVLSSSQLSNLEIIHTSIMNIDTYPSFQIIYKGKMNRMGVSSGLIVNYISVFYEDFVLTLLASRIDKKEFEKIDALSLMIFNSVIFPDQYE
uniref:hypothetical protein n=1 Tax=Flavobacterium sp. TaxID=239 RepID=UPI00404B5AB8